MYYGYTNYEYIQKIPEFHLLHIFLFNTEDQKYLIIFFPM